MLCERWKEESVFIGETTYDKQTFDFATRGKIGAQKIKAVNCKISLPCCNETGTLEPKSNAQTILTTK